MKSKEMRKTKTVQRKALKKLAKQLYSTGLTMREVGAKVGRSRMWVCTALKKK